MTALTVIASTFPSRTRSGLTDQATASGARSTRGPRPQSRPFHGARAAAPLGRPVGGLPLALPCPAHAGPLSRGSWWPTGHRTRRHTPSRSQPSGGPRALAPGCRRAKASGLASRPVGALHWPGAGGGGRAGSGEVLSVVPPCPGPQPCQPPCMAPPPRPPGKASRAASPHAGAKCWPCHVAPQDRASDPHTLPRAGPSPRGRRRTPLTGPGPQQPKGEARIRAAR